jgi:hypothetical protein
MKQPKNDEDDRHDLLALCARQLEREEALLAAALPIVRGMQAAFALQSLDAFVAALSGHAAFVKLLEEINTRRQAFRDELGQQLRIAAHKCTLASALAALPANVRPPLVAQAARVRRLADELAALNYRISIHLRIYLDAYRRILRDLTNTSASSGRYGPAGRTEAHDYRPLLQIHG